MFGKERKKTFKNLVYVLGRSWISWMKSSSTITTPNFVVLCEMIESFDESSVLLDKDVVEFGSFFFYFKTLKDLVTKTTNLSKCWSRQCLQYLWPHLVRTGCCIGEKQIKHFKSSSTGSIKSSKSPSDGNTSLWLLPICSKKECFSRILKARCALWYLIKSPALIA